MNRIVTMTEPGVVVPKCVRVVNWLDSCSRILPLAS